MLPKQSVINAYKTCSQSSKTQVHRLDSFAKSDAGGKKQTGDQRANFSEELRKKMRGSGESH